MIFPPSLMIFGAPPKARSPTSHPLIPRPPLGAPQHFRPIEGPYVGEAMAQRRCGEAIGAMKSADSKPLVRRYEITIIYINLLYTICEHW